MKELNYTELRNFVVPRDVDIEAEARRRTDEGGLGIIGQSRAEKALAFGLSIKAKGYNIYVMGPPGTGKTTFSKAFALKAAAVEPTPPDLCYVFNFSDPKCPKTLSVPAGVGRTLKTDMEELVERLQDELPKVFGAKDFENRKADIVKTYQNKRDHIIKDMTEEARGQEFGVKTTNSGIYFMPIVEGEVISEDQYDKLSQTQKDDISKNSETIQKQAQQVMREIREYEKQTKREVEDLEYSIGLFAVGRQMQVLLDKYAAYGDVVKHLLSVKEDILDNLACFVEQEYDDDESIQALLPWVSKRGADEGFTKYFVNLITDNAELNGAPVIMDFNPTYANLIGEIEYDNEYGNLITDFMKIKPGLLHKANGGYLILQAHDVLSSVHGWETLRRVLLTKEVVIEPFREYSTGFAVSGIKPKPMPVDVKVILVGISYYYDVLYQYDDDFQKLFKICAEFDSEMDLNRESVLEMARFIKSYIEKENLPPFSPEAVAAVVEYSGRLAASQAKLSTRFNRIADILTEAAAWAGLSAAGSVGKEHVAQAIRELERRFALYEDKLTEMLMDGYIMIDTQGEKVGQINGLAVIDLGEYAFAKPSRITATTYVGKAGIINIEQEAEMSGHIHDKGMQVLAGFLGQMYAQDFPLSLSCRVCFEQSYSDIDGDSASSAELYVILSSLADLPISQELAVTGSINQRGDIQPIGGVTYKIEGFFDLCEKRGLTGAQGVIIPAHNVVDLMLRDNVVEAVKAGKFHIYAINHIDEGIELLTGVAAGVKNENGKYPPDTVHGRAYKKLRAFHKRSLVE